MVVLAELPLPTDETHEDDRTGVMIASEILQNTIVGPAKATGLRLSESSGKPCCPRVVDRPPVPRRLRGPTVFWNQWRAAAFNAAIPRYPVPRPGDRGGAFSSHGACHHRSMLFRRPDGSINKRWVLFIVLGVPVVVIEIVMMTLLVGPPAGPWVLGAAAVIAVAAVIAARSRRRW